METPKQQAIMTSELRDKTGKLISSEPKPLKMKQITEKEFFDKPKMHSFYSRIQKKVSKHEVEHPEKDEDMEEIPVPKTGIKTKPINKPESFYSEIK